MEPTFIRDNTLDFLKQEIKEIEFFPEFQEISSKLEKKTYEIIYLKIDGQLVGGCLWYKRGGDGAHIYLLFIKKQFRRKGYAQKLLNYILSAIKNKGYTRVLAFTDKSNIKMINLLSSIGFRFTSFDFEKQGFLFLKNIKETEDYEILLHSLFFEENLLEKGKILKKLLLNSSQSLEILKKISLQNLDIDKLSPLNKFRYLKYLADSNKSEGLDALKELGDNLEEISNIIPITERLKLLKYVGIHAKKEISSKAIFKLYENRENILELKNIELKASLLRYLVMHLRGEEQKKVASLIDTIEDKQVKDTSLDYLKIYAKNEK